MGRAIIEGIRRVKKWFVRKIEITDRWVQVEAETRDHAKVFAESRFNTGDGVNTNPRVIKVTAQVC